MADYSAKPGDVWYEVTYRSPESESIRRLTVTRATATKVMLRDPHGGRDIEISRRTGHEVGAKGYWLARYFPVISDEGAGFHEKYKTQRSRSKCVYALDRLNKSVNERRLSGEQYEKIAQFIDENFPKASENSEASP